MEFKEFKDRLLAADAKPTYPPKKPVLGDLHIEGKGSWLYQGKKKGWQPHEPTEQERAAWIASQEARDFDEKQELAKSFAKAIQRALPGYRVQVEYRVAQGGEEAGYYITANGYLVRVVQFVPEPVFRENTADVSLFQKFMTYLTVCFQPSEELKPTYTVSGSNGWQESNTTNSWRVTAASNTGSYPRDESKINPMEFPDYEARRSEELKTLEQEAIQSILGARLDP